MKRAFTLIELLVVAGVSFIDGHVEFVNRKFAQTREHNVGNLADFTTGNNPNPTFQ
jgi:hypothetical protein